MLIIARIVAQNLIPKTGSFDHFASDKINAVYAIFAKIKVDWATIFINNMASKHTKFLPFGSFLTLIFQHFNVDLTNEPKVESKRDFFDGISLSRMRISLDSTPKPSSHSRSRASTSSTSSTSSSTSSSSEICDRLDRLETRRQSLGIPSKSESDSSEDSAGGSDGDGSGDGDDDGSDDGLSLEFPPHPPLISDSDRGTADGSGSSDSKDDGKGDRDSEGGEDELSSFL
ncbi:suppressor protein SRP40-like [Asparagus officinalis]|uniref:suppressor protein SRP40-like n=1 Tax=Asparagus officinalis TaxID=4686 RepID=UPI00098E29F2|nr:suppressor protein SRP40-like [Asparagus officinalis]